MSFPRSLRARLLLAFFLVIGATLGTVAVAALLVGPGYFAEAMGHLPGDPMGAAMDAATRAAFNEAMQRALVAATVIAIVSATVVNLAVAARIAGPSGPWRRPHDGSRVGTTPQPDHPGRSAARWRLQGRCRPAP